MPFTRLLRIGGAFAFLLGAGGALGVSIGQKDTFSDGTTQNWNIQFFSGGSQGSPPAEAFPVNVPAGGPAGAGDSYLRLTGLGGFGPGSRLSVFNINNQWAGNYVDAGAQSVRLDVNNLGLNDVALRLLFGDPGAGPPQNVAISLSAILVPAGSGWLSITFPIEPSDLLALQGSVGGALSGATELRLFHSPVAEFPGLPIIARIGVDNIEALGNARVPDAGATVWLVSCSLFCLARLRRSS